MTVVFQIVYVAVIMRRSGKSSGKNVRRSGSSSAGWKKFFIPSPRAKTSVADLANTLFPEAESDGDEVGLSAKCPPTQHTSIDSSLAQHTSAHVTFAEDLSTQHPHAQGSDSQRPSANNLPTQHPSAQPISTQGQPTGRHSAQDPSTQGLSSDGAGVEAPPIDIGISAEHPPMESHSADSSDDETTEGGHRRRTRGPNQGVRTPNSVNNRLPITCLNNR